MSGKKPNPGPETKAEIPTPDEIKEVDAEVRAEIEKIEDDQLRHEEERRILPEPAEPKEPKPAETGKAETVQEAKVLQSEGSQFPMPMIRPQPPQKVKEEGSVIVAKELAGQLGTSPEIKAQQRIDERKFAVLDDGTLAALSHFSYRYVYDEIRYWGHICEWWLTGSQGIGGLGRRHALQAIASSSGTQSIEKAKKPNVIARNIWDRKWKERAEKRGEVLEDED